MGKLLKKLFYALLICSFLYTCVYHQVTHLSSDELEWVTNRKVGEIMYFKSQFGEVDTVEIFNTYINNSLSPLNFAYFNISQHEYIANASVFFTSKNKSGMDGDLFVKKPFNGKPIVFSGGVFMKNRETIPLKLTTLRLHNQTLDDVMFFGNLKPLNNDLPENPVMSYAWSKKYGLVQYTFKDGTVFTRIDIK